MNRSDSVSQLRTKERCDVLIIGGGVNGIATFRDLALQGVDVVLIEKNDYCSGCSAASSHMVHGGIRYLENGEFRLVREAVKERNRLLKNAPHLVDPLATVIPIFKTFSGTLNAPLKFLGLLDRPSERGAFVIKAGLMMYDAYTGRDGTVPNHRFLSRTESLKHFPALNNDIINTAIYYDAAMPSPERICIDMLVDTTAMVPAALAVNYVAAVGAADGAVTLRDELTGDSFNLSPELVINAAGPWIDMANETLGRPTNFLGGTKGSHLVLDHPELLEALRGNEFFFENKDGRIVLIYPLLNRVLVGTTDIKVDSPEDVRCTEAEIDYFFDLVKRVFPNIEVNRSHIVFQFAGVRPLPASDAGSTGQISRDHTNRVQEPDDKLPFPVFNLIGGKWTTHRAFAAQVTDDTLDYLGQERQVGTEAMPYGGGRNYPTDKVAQEAWLLELQSQTELPLERLRQLFARYGTRAEAIARYIAADDDTPLQGQPQFSQREILYLANEEGVVHLDDICLRRTLLGMLGYLDRSFLEELCAITAAGLGWDEGRQQQELSRTMALLAEKHGLAFNKGGS